MVPFLIFGLLSLHIQPSLQAALKTLKEGDSCRLENKLKGFCRKLADCSSAIESLTNDDKWPMLCSYKRTDIICCDEGGHNDTELSKVQKKITITTTNNPIKTESNISNDDTRISERVQEPRFSQLPPGIITRHKCFEYSTWQTAATLSVVQERMKVAGQCGVVGATFVYGGTEASRLEFPHMARLGYGEDINELSWHCGGSLISENFVITAAHCLKGFEGANLTHVLLGSADPRANEIIRIIEIIPHPNYDYTKAYNDLALLRLSKNIRFNDYKRPACLQGNHFFRDIIGTATGWGATEQGNRRSKVLLKVNLPILKTDSCKELYTANRYKLPRGIDEQTHMCAGSLESKKDTCQGDSGGPLQIVLNNPRCMYSIVGITSFGIKCGIAPGVYTRVSGFIPWIESIVWPTVEKNFVDSILKRIENYKNNAPRQ